MTADVETIVVGAGVIGLAITLEVAARGRHVLVLEQHAHTGSETTSRNSEVVHAGLYYPPGSLKARTCLAGRTLLYRFAADNGVPFRRCGKLLIATSAEDVAKLAHIAANAAACGVDDLSFLTAADVRAMEPSITCVSGLLSPSTGIIDGHAFLDALEGNMQSLGGEMVLNARVSGLQRCPSGYQVWVAAGAATTTAITCRNLVIAGGLHSSALATLLFADPASRYHPPATHFAKGHYFSISGKVPFQRLIYPVPEAGGLGVHLTLDIAGHAKLGPDITFVDRISYAFQDDDGARRKRFLAETARWWPGVADADLQPGTTGIRPKLSGPGEPAADFAVHDERQHGMAGLVALYGIESPGLTAALAIAQHVAALLD